ncbi:MAG TPA: ATP-binding protein [Croceibacterium sp.]|nr:ATP-binding protein [Croceibacterium sp.]
MRLTVFQRMGRGLLERRWITGVLALLLLTSSLVLGWQRERAAIGEEARGAGSQAELLAGSLAGALAFDDLVTTREQLDALKLDPDIQAAGVYGADGTFVAGFAKRGDPLPRTVQPHEPEIVGRQLSVVVPVREGNLMLGSIYLRTSIEPFAERLSRYLAIGVVILMAALLIAILGASNAASAAANRRLQSEIVAREQAETALRHSQKMEALGQLTGGVAHDFNNLLMAASSGLELMGRAKTDERREQLTAGVRDALDRGARLTEQLLAFSRRSPVHSRPIAVAAHIDKLVDLLDHALGETVSVRFDIPADLWPVEVDVSQFDVAILNIAVNARDAMPRGGQICITARNRADALDGEDAVEIAIQDEGLGMAREAVERAFEPFFTTKDVGRGTGLGLSQVYGFARSAGGTVAIASEPGAGTTVTLLLPRGPAVASERADAGGASAVARDFGGLRILLVEDDPDLNELVGQMLEELGADVLRAKSADEGGRLLEGATVDAVVSDMVMPGEMDGLDLARRLRERREELPIVLMTGYSEAAGSAAKEGFPVLRKPFTLDALVGVLGTAVAGGRG